MTTPRIAVATITLVRDAAEDGVLRDATATLVQHPYPVIVADGGSGDAFLAFLRTQPRLTLVIPDTKGLVAQVAAAMRSAAATGADLVLYTESDKRDFFERGLAAFLKRSTSAEGVAGRTPISLASRTPASYETFPPVQRYTEKTINDLCGESFAAPGDYSYGPFLIPSLLVPWLERVPRDLGWGWRHFIFAVAHRLGHPMIHVDGDFTCPADQHREAERERLHRLRQLDQNVSGLQLGLTVPLTPPG